MNLQTLLHRTHANTLTEESVNAFIHHSTIPCVFKDLDGHYLAISEPARVTLPGAKNCKKIKGSKENQLLLDDHLAFFYHSNDIKVKNGSSWHGLEPLYWLNEKVLSIVHKYPVYDSHDHITSVFCYSSHIDHTEILRLIDAMDNVDRTSASQQSYCPDHPPHKLTKRQSMCLLYLLRGKTAKEIGKILQISPRTVECYIAQLKVKFQCSRKSELISKALNHGYLYKLALIIN